MNRRFYDGDQSYLKNLFQCHPDDANPSHFIRLEILQWLRIRFRKEGPTGVKGYHKASKLISELIDLGYEAERIRAELLYFVKSGCILSEHQDSYSIVDEDLIAVSASGHVHLLLVTNLDYLAAITEDTWFDDASLARRISDRIGRRGIHGHYLPKTTTLNAIEMGRYITRRAADRLPRSSKFLYEPQDQISTMLNAVNEAVAAARREYGIGDAWEGAASRYPSGTVVEGIISGIKDFGVFVEVERGLNGLLPRAAFVKARAKALPNIQRGARLKVKILSVDEVEYRIEMDLA